MIMMMIICQYRNSSYFNVGISKHEIYVAHRLQERHKAKIMRVTRLRALAETFLPFGKHF